MDKSRGATASPKSKSGHKEVYTITEDDDLKRKIVFLGDSGVGKTSLIQRFVNNSSSSSGPTIGAAEFQRTVPLNHLNLSLKFEIWDVSGQDKFRSLTNMYYRDADAAILVYDISDKQSFENLKNLWLEDVIEKAPENVQIVILGNKNDLGAERVTFKEVQEVALQNRALMKIVSAKKNQGLAEIF